MPDFIMVADAAPGDAGGEMVNLTIIARQGA